MNDTQLWGLPWQLSGKEPACTGGTSVQETEGMWVPSLGGEDPLEKEMAAHSSIIAWEIPQTEEPDGGL